MQSLLQGWENFWSNDGRRRFNSHLRDEPSDVQEEKEEQHLPLLPHGPPVTPPSSRQVSGGDRPDNVEAMPGSNVEAKSDEETCEREEEPQQHISDTPPASVLNATDNGSTQSNGQTTSQHAAGEESLGSTLGIVLSSNREERAASFALAFAAGVKNQRRKRKK
jgi:hypothetical protein